MCQALPCLQLCGTVSAACAPVLGEAGVVEALDGDVVFPHLPGEGCCSPPPPPPHPPPRPPPPRSPDPSGHSRTSTASARSQWALPDPNRDFQVAVGLNRDFQIAVGTAGPQREEKMSDRMSEDMPGRMPERMSEKMSEDMPDKMSDRMPEDMPDRMPEDLPVRKCINVMVGITRSKVIFSVSKSPFWLVITYLLQHMVYSP